MITTSNMGKLRARIAEAGIRRQDIANYLGYSESMFSYYLNDKRPAPENFEDRVSAALDRLEAAERAAQEARERVLAETEEGLE